MRHHFSCFLVFDFVDDVVSNRPYPAMQKYLLLIKDGENEIKLLSLLLRQFRLIETCMENLEQGISDSKILGSRLGVHPFFVNNIIRQSRRHSDQSLNGAIQRLAHCDHQMKTGDSSLFDAFLIPYFSSQGEKNLSINSLIFASSK